MENPPLLSVIVPCYNLEEYVDKCVSSIVGQTYSNLEILLIDDGSSDNTGVLCDLWQEKDQRIRVVHKPNEGLSYARKTGIEHTTADYVTFVDVDDWISPDMYADMMSALLTTHSDIAQCGYCMVYDETSSPPLHQNRSAKFEIVSREEGVLLILDDKKWKSFLWNKIFKKRLFDHVTFHKGLNLGEDFISHDLFHQASQSVYLPDEYYFYNQRKGSMLNSNNISSKMKKEYDFSQAIYSRYLFVTQHPQYHRMLQDAQKRVIIHGFRFLRDMMVYPKSASKEWFDTQARQLRSIAVPRKNILSRGLKLDLFLLKIHPKCFIIFRKLYYMIKKVPK